MEHRSPEAFALVGDVIKAEVIQDHGPQQDHQRCRQGNATKRAPNAPHAEFIESLAPVEPSPQGCSLHHKSLKKRGDGHQAKPPRQDHQSQHRLAEGREIITDVDDRQSRHGDC